MGTTMRIPKIILELQEKKDEIDSQYEQTEETRRTSQTLFNAIVELMKLV